MDNKFIYLFKSGNLEGAKQLLEVNPNINIYEYAFCDELIN